MFVCLFTFFLCMSRGAIYPLIIHLGRTPHLLQLYNIQLVADVQNVKNVKKIPGFSSTYILVLPAHLILLGIGSPSYFLYI